MRFARVSCYGGSLVRLAGEVAVLPAAVYAELLTGVRRAAGLSRGGRVSSEEQLDGAVGQRPLDDDRMTLGRVTQTWSVG